MSQTVALHFETQDPDEEIVLFLRAHPITNLGWIVTVLALVLAGFLITVGGMFVPQGIFGFLDRGDIILLFLFWLLLLSGFSVERFLHWFFNVHIITNKEVVDIDFFHLFFKQVSQAHLENIQDVTYKTVGLIQSHLNYGHLYIQTAGEKQNLEFLSIKNPDQVQDKLLKLAAEAKRRVEAG